MPKKGEIDLQRLDYWKSVLEDFETTGLSGQAYCRQNGIPYTAFANRRRRLPETIRAAAKAKSKHVEFAEVAIKDSPTPAETPSPTIAERLELVLPKGTVLRIPNGYSPAALSKIVSALEG
jgi:hypothetical protein